MTTIEGILIRLRALHGRGATPWEVASFLRAAAFTLDLKYPKPPVAVEPETDAASEA